MNNLTNIQFKKPCKLDFSVIKNYDTLSFYTIPEVPKPKRIKLKNNENINRKVIKRATFQKKCTEHELFTLQKLNSYLRHPNIVHMISCGMNIRGYYLVLPRMKTDLFEYSLNKVFSLSDIKKMMKQLSNALKFIHNKNIIHCDLKPENILLNYNNDYLLCDFESANLISNKNITLPKKKIYS